MRNLLLLVLVVFIISCSSEEQKEEKEEEQKEFVFESQDFEKYITSLKQIPIPFTFSLNDELILIDSTAFDSLSFDMFKQKWATQPLGIMAKHETGVITIDCLVSDYGLVPYIMSYDRAGNKIDSLAPFQKSGYDIGYESIERLFIKNRSSIQVIDSTKVWELNADSTDIVEGTMKLSVDTIVYKVNSEGKFVSE